MNGFPEVVGSLREILGAKLVAYLGELGSTGELNVWVSSDLAPSMRVQERLIIALKIAKVILIHDSKTVVQSWFQGMNPSLGDKSPAAVLRDGSKRQWDEVLLAAQGFSTMSFS